MKFARPLLITLGAVALVGIAALGCVLTPSFQRWAVLRAFSGRPGLKVEAAGVSAGFSGLTLRGVRVEKNGLRVELDHLEADYSLWQVLVDRRLHVHQLTAGGIVVDASRRSRSRTQAAAAGAPVATPGLLGRVQLPFVLVLGDCRIEGRALLPGSAGKPPVEADYKITGGKFAPGEEGALLLTATVRNPAADAGVAALNAQVSLRATQTAQRSFSRVALTAVVDAEGRNFSEQNQLKIFAELRREAAGENYAVSVDTLIRGAAENLLAVRSALPAGRQEYAGQWTLKARTAQLAPFTLGTALPEFDARGTGRFAFAPATRAVDLQGNLQVDASRLEAIDAAWQAIGAVKLQAQFDVAADGDVARLRQLELKLAGDQPVLELHAASAAEFNFRERRLHVGGAATGEVLTMNLSGLPLAWVRPFVTGVDLSGGMITGAFAITAEKDLLRLRSTRPLQVDALTAMSHGQPLLTEADISLDADAVLRAKELEIVVRGLTLKTPAGDALKGALTATWPLQPDPALAFTASYTADLPKLLAPWLPVGRVRATGDADFTLAGGRLESRHATADFADAEGRAVLKATTLRPFAYDPVSRRALTGEKSPVDLIRLTLGRIPLEEVPLNQPGARLGGTVTQGEFVLTGDGEKMNLRTTTPVKLAGVSLTQGGRPALSGLAIELVPMVELNGRAGTLQSGNVTLRNADGALLAGIKIEATQAAEGGQRGSLTFNLEVPALAAQPLFAGAHAASAGRASGEIRVALGAASQVEARMTVNGLVARDSEQTLPVANLSFRGVVQENGKITVQAPLLLDRAGQRSDLDFSLDLTPAGRGFAVDGKLSGEHVELADALAVLGVFRGDPAPARDDVPATPTAGTAAPVTPAPSVDTQSAWSRFNGQLAVDVKSVTRGTDWSMTGLTGLLQIDPTKVSLQKLEAAFGEKGRLAAKGDLSFTTAAEPYRLGGDFSLTEFDAGRLFKALEPTRPPTIEGIFTVAGHFAGQGGTLEETGRKTRGRFDLTSRQGIFRGLQRTSNKVSVATKAVELGASVLGSLFGSEKVTKAAEKVVGTAYFVDQLALNIGEFNYDQLNVRLVRDDTLNMALEDISLVSPEMRLVGKGTVTYVEGKPLLEQPLNAALVFSARGRIEQLLGKLRLLDGARDELGYAKTPTPVTIAGSLAKPDPSAFFTKVASAKLTELLAPEN